MQKIDFLTYIICNLKIFFEDFPKKYKNKIEDKYFKKIENEIIKELNKIREEKGGIYTYIQKKPQFQLIVLMEYKIYYPQFKSGLLTKEEIYKKIADEMSIQTGEKINKNKIKNIILNRNKYITKKAYQEARKTIPK